MATELSNHFKFALNSGDIDFDADTFKLMLMATGFTFDKDAHENLDDVSASELSAGNGYSAGGATLANKAVSEDDANDRSDVTCDDVVWNASGGNIGPTPGAVLYKDTGTPSTSVVVGFIDFGQDITVFDGNPLTVESITVRLQ